MLISPDKAGKLEKSIKAMSLHIYRYHIPNVPANLLLSSRNYNVQHPNIIKTQLIFQHPQRQERRRPASQLRPNRSRSSPLATVTAAAAGVPLPPLDLTEDNVRQVLADARAELGQIFDTSVGITGQVDLAELDGPFVKISLKGRFWHKRSTVLARIGNYLKQRIPEILEVDIEDEKQLDDSPENF